MTYTVQFKPLALRQLEKLPRDIQKKLAARIEALRDEPFPSGCRKMAVIPDAWRARELATIASFIRFSRKCHWCLCLRLDTGKMYIGDFEGAAVDAVLAGVQGIIAAKKQCHPERG